MTSDGDLVGNPPPPEPDGPPTRPDHLDDRHVGDDGSAGDGPHEPHPRPRPRDAVRLRDLIPPADDDPVDDRPPVAPDDGYDGLTAPGRASAPADGYPGPPPMQPPPTDVLPPVPPDDPLPPSGLPPHAFPPGDRPRTELAIDGEEPPEKKRSPLRSLVEWVVVIVGALVVATVIKTFLFQAFWIPSESMLPTLEEEDRVLVNKLSYDLHDVHRGDVIVFERPPGETQAIKDLIKRVIAVEGDTLTLQDGKVLVNGEAVDEPYVVEGSQSVNICAFTGTVKVPEDHVFVMGDNRENSKDSRCFGPISEDLIVGRAFVRVWPLNALGTL